MKTLQRKTVCSMLIALLVLLTIGLVASAAPVTTASPTTLSQAAAPCAGSWTSISNLPISLADEAVTHQGNYIYTFSGVSTGVIVNNAYKYDGRTWTPIAPLPVALREPSAVSDGTYIYIVNGADTNTARNNLYRYNPATNSYTTLAPSPQATFGQSVSYLNGKLYRIGGNTVVGSFEPTNRVDVYTIATNTWAPAANYPSAVAFSASIGNGGYIYSAGGADYIDTPLIKTYRYDPARNLWDDNAFADMPQGFGRTAAASDLIDGQWILAGGRILFGTSDNVIATNLSTTWTFLPSMIAARAEVGGATLNNVFHVLGGKDAQTNGTTRTDQRYKPAICGLPRHE